MAGYVVAQPLRVKDAAGMDEYRAQLARPSSSMGAGSWCGARRVTCWRGTGSPGS
jgi:hypothetical protein